MNSKQAADRMEEIEREIKEVSPPFFNSDWLRESKYLKLKREAKEIYEEFKDGCRTFCGEINCGQIKGYADFGIFLCPNCQRIHKSWERINR